MTLVSAGTEYEVTLKGPDVEPAGIVMLAGTDATAGSELERETTAPPVGAGWLSVAVPLALAVATTVAGLTVMADKAGGAGVTVSVAVFVVPLYTAVIVTFVEEATLKVEITKMAEDEDEGTVAVPGTDATLGFELERATFAPAAGADPVRVTVPVEAVPAETLAGDMPTDVSTAGVTVSVADREPVEYVAVIVTGVDAPTGEVVTVNVFDVCPAVTVTFAGTVAALAFELVRLTTAPPTGAELRSVTVPVEEPPPRTLVGDSESDATGFGGAVRKAGIARSASHTNPVFALRGTFVIESPLEPKSVVDPIC